MRACLIPGHANERARTPQDSRDPCVYLRHLYEERVMEAEHVLSRVVRLEKMGHRFSEIERLRDLHGRHVGTVARDAG